MSAAEQDWDAAVARLRRDRPELAERLRSAAEIRAEADRRAAELARQAEAAVGFGGGLGGFLGTAAAIFTDPVQVLALPVGVGRVAGSLLTQIGKTALAEGAIAGAVQAAVEASAGAYRAEIGAPGSSAERIAAAAAGGAVIGGGLRALLAGVERALARRALSPADALEARTSAAAARADDMLAAANPAGPEGAPAHERAAVQAVAAKARGEVPPVEVPGAAAADAVAQRLVALTPDELRAHVRAAIEDVLTTQGRRTDAAWRDDLGAITIDWGQPGDPTRDFRGGYGLSHIIVKRTAEGIDGEAFVRDVLPDLLLQGQLSGMQLRGSPRVLLDWQDWRAVLRLDRNGQTETWLLTAFEQRRGPGGTGGEPPLPPYAPAGRSIDQPEGARPGPSDLPQGPRRFKVYAPTGRAVVVEAQVVELDRLIPSHGPDGRPNPAYPHAEGVQPRDRGSAPSQDQVRAIAAGLIPDRLRPNVEGGLGAPVIGPDLAVESGNARVAALSLIYRDDRFAAQRAAYRAMVEAFDPAARDMRAPVLVSKRITPLTPAERAAWARELNARPVAAAPTLEEARADAALVARHIDLWRGREVDAAANAEFVRAVLDGMSAEERMGLLDRAGRLTGQAKARLERALLTAAYGDELGPLLERLLVADGEGYRAVAGALRDVAGEWAGLRAAIARGEVHASLDTTASLAEAVRWLDEARTRRLPLRELLAQLDIDRPPPTDLARAWLAAMHTGPDLTGRLRGRDRLAELLRGYVEQAHQHTTAPNMFGLPPASARDVLAAVVRRGSGEAVDAPPARPAGEVAGKAVEPASAARQPLGGRVGAPATAEQPVVARLREAEAAQARLAADPATAAAELQEARRIAAERDLPVPDETGAVRGARELLDEIEAEQRQAAEAAACLIGAAAGAVS
ncbi:MAG: hypothetical protein RMK90_14950 [Acetobacteraceae bacterium]|nr:hypothetical protein [Acetobacteraceae bacterium]